MTALRPHPIAELFPRIDGEQLADLAEDIERNGLIEPIVTFDGQILDGRNRLAACHLAGVEPAYRTFEGEPSDIPAWIISKNLFRRHLSASQRAMIAAKMAERPPGHGNDPGKFAGVPSQAEAADLVGVSERSVRDARAVLTHAEPELVRQVEQGEVAVSDAAAAVRPGPDGEPVRYATLFDRDRHPPDPDLVAVEDVAALPTEVQARPKCRHSGRPVGTCTCRWCAPPATPSAEPPSSPPTHSDEATAAVRAEYFRTFEVLRDWVVPQLTRGAVPSEAARKYLRESLGVRFIGPAQYRWAAEHGEEQDLWLLSGDLSLLPAPRRAPATVPPPPPEPARAPLADDQRAPFDAYWTPDATALACVRWLIRELSIDPAAPFTAIEPCVGGGAWVRALRELAPSAIVDRADLDPRAPGLGGARRGVEQSWGGRDWLGDLPSHPHVKRRTWDLCIGNRPYDGPFDRWFELSCQRAAVVAYLERETVTGTEARLPWWTEHPPAFVAKVVPRPKWDGPGKRDTADFSDTVLVVWLTRVSTCSPLVALEQARDTRFRWIDVPALGGAR